MLTRQFGSQTAPRAAVAAQRSQRHRHGTLPLLATRPASTGSLPVSGTAARSQTLGADVLLPRRPERLHGL
ncbi:hypothetical protein, partial [Streptomyces diastaticus]